MIIMCTHVRTYLCMILVYMYVCLHEAHFAEHGSAEAVSAHPLCLVELKDLRQTLELLLHLQQVRVASDGEVKQLLCVGQLLTGLLILSILGLELF